MGQLLQTPASEHRRTLPVLSWNGKAGLQSLDIPKDTVIKRLEIRMKGSFDVTYAAGAPVSSPTGFMGRVIQGGIQVVANGSRYIKTLDPYMLSRMNLLLMGQVAERAYTTGAAAPTSHIAQTEKAYGESFVYPATTQFVTINESIVISFEMPWADKFGRETTLFNTRNLSSAVIQFNFVDLSNIQQDGGAVAITYGNVNLSLYVSVVETPDIPRDQVFLDYRQSFKRETFSSEQRGKLIDCPKGNFLANIEFLVKNGDANKTLSDAAITDIELRLNGSRMVQSTTFLALQQGWRTRRGINSPRGTSSAGVTHALQGYAMMNLLKNEDIRTALDTSLQAGVDQVQLLLTSAAATGGAVIDGATYTNPVEVTLQFGEIVRVG